jgi:ankyrin repeat protein
MSDLAALIDAAKAGDDTRVRDLLRQDPSLGSARTDSGESAIMTALYRGHRAVIDTLLEAGPQAICRWPWAPRQR